MKIRSAMRVAVVLASLSGIGVALASQSGDAPGNLPGNTTGNQTEQVIKINTRKFEFLPGSITLKKGVPVIIELTSSDVIMGFNVPDMKSRATVIPGVVTRIRLVPQNVGVFTFFCDIFCGDGHEDMSGTIAVTA